MNKLLFNEHIEDNRVTQFVDVLLPVPIPQHFTYRVPKNLEEEIGIGSRIIVQFGHKRIITGILVNIHQTPPENYEAKYILEVLDPVNAPTVLPVQLSFFHWISSYYMSAPGEVLHVGIPSGLKLSSESKIQLHPNFSKASCPYPFDKHETSILDVLEGAKNLNYSQVSDITGLKNIYAVIKSLVKKESIILYEEVKEKYSPKTETRIRLSKALADDQKALEAVFQQLEKNPKQVDVLLSYLRSVPVFKDKKSNDKGISKKDLDTIEVSSSSLKTLVRNEIFEEFTIIKSRFEDSAETEERKALAPFQQDAYDQILSNFEEKKPVLLHGITGSGKTEIYINLIENVLENGYQVLYLLPEIALTTQMVGRLKKVFGNRMGVYHSKFSDNERVEVYQGVRNGTFDFIIGVRSSIFLPFENLGLIIIDEEHESSYKQNEPAPRYHARDSALYLAQLHKSKVLLGSATPSIETYFQTTEKNYGLVELNERFGKSILPTIAFADISRERKKKTMQGEFTTALIQSIEESLSSNHQVIIFQNRRGYAPYMHCDTCGWIPKCQNCSVSLTYHLYKNELRCHYCGYREKVAVSCPVCKSDELNTKSFGTEKLEEDLKFMLKDHQVGRMDLDTTRNKFGYKTILDNFEKGAIDVLVGTQMVSKGLDFENVSLVGIVDADRMINFPDFRATERTFQLITQVSGRAGRREKQGTVVIQTFNPEQQILKHIQAYDYSTFFDDELAERKSFHYPPFYRLIGITLKHADAYTCAKAAGKLHKALAHEFGNQRTLGPQEGMIAKIRNMYIWEILIKFERTKVNLGKVKQIIKEKSSLLKSEKEFRNLRIIFDVDPY